LPSRAHAGRDPPDVEICQCPLCTSGNGRTITSFRPDSFDTYASQCPSGEISGWTSANGALRSVSGCGLPPTRNTAMSQPLVPVGCSSMTMDVPSRPMDGVYSPFGLVVSRSAVPVPSAACQNRLGTPALDE